MSLTRQYHLDVLGVSPERLDTIFDPDFRAENGRVATTNWGLFVSRSIMTEHGGGLELESTEGEGTTATTRLPK